MTFTNGPALLNSAERPAPRVGGIIEDETGWWQIIDICETGEFDPYKD